MLDNPERIFREEMRHCRLYRDEHECYAKLDEGKWGLGWTPIRSGVQRTTLALEIDEQRKVCYLLSIAIPPELRGKGYGAELYQVTENVARRWGCATVEMTASGQTHKGESRIEYLRRRGYTLTTEITVRKALHPSLIKVKS